MEEYPLSPSGVNVSIQDSRAYVLDFTRRIFEDRSVPTHVRPFALAFARRFSQTAYSGFGLGLPGPAKSRKDLPDVVLQSLCVTAVMAALVVYEAGREAQARGRFDRWAEENKIHEDIRRLF